ncbi:MAG: hypothetical protein R3A10_07045 [Caldilineaceae bacterium]
MLPLRPLDLATVRGALTSTWQLSPARADLLARLSTGRLGWAVQRSGRCPVPVHPYDEP